MEIAERTTTIKQVFNETGFAVLKRFWHDDEVAALQEVCGFLSDQLQSKMIASSRSFYCRNAARSMSMSSGRLQAALKNL